MTISFDGKVCVVTGAGNGLGRCHALALSKRGAKVVVNDLGGARDGTGASSEAADTVVDEIIKNGGEAFSHGANVTNGTTSVRVPHSVEVNVINSDTGPVSVSTQSSRNARMRCVCAEGRQRVRATWFDVAIECRSRNA